MDTSTRHKRIELRQAIDDLREHGLLVQAQWAAEQLAGLPADDDTSPLPPPTARSLAQLDDVYLLARTHFDLKGASDPLHVFLRCYATYLYGEKRKEEARQEQAGKPNQPSTTSNPNPSNPMLGALERELCEAINKGTGDGFLTFLYGLILIDREQLDQARTVLVRSLQQYPCNWGAWKALETLCPDAATATALALPRHWLRDLFLASLSLTLHDHTHALQRLEAIAAHLPHSSWVTCSIAEAHYHLRNFDEAQELLEDCRQAEPYRLQGLDMLSNILYVKEDFAQLSSLAHTAALVNKYTPETCCIVGNYYSLKGAHEMAIVHFRRALRLDPQSLGAWVLMGHEFVELKNAPAAIEAYRQATTVNPSDYRTWYGLGQAYELVQEPYYALYYYRRASQLAPSDARMWCAMGQCYASEHLGQVENAIRCYRRAVQHGDREGIALHKLAQLHDALGQRTAAAHYYARNLQRIDAEGLTGSDLVEALQYLAQHCKEVGRLQEAEEHCMRLLDFGAPNHKERAKGLLCEVRELQAQGHGPPHTPVPRLGFAEAPDPGSGGSDMQMDALSP